MNTTKTKAPRPGRTMGLKPLSDNEAYRGAPKTVPSDKPLDLTGKPLKPNAHLTARSVA